MAEFQSFVVFANRRTGSNFLESNLNALRDVTCHGELFNPGFVGFPNQPEGFGMTVEAREANPSALLDHVKSTAGLNGFRYFTGHTPRVFEELLKDPTCGKILLSRDPLESFISLEIARTTKQWKLTDESRRRFEPVMFSPKKFDRYASDIEAFERTIIDAVRGSGQAILYLDYDMLGSLDVINRVAAFLGTKARLGALDTSTKKQNPQPMSEKVVNYDDMMEALAFRQARNAQESRRRETNRGPSIHTYLGSPRSGLLYQVLRSGPTSVVSDWMADFDGVKYRDLHKDFTVASLRDWRDRNPKHRFFTVLRHPVARAHAAFCDKILSTGKGSYPEIRNTLRQTFGLEIPECMPDESYDDLAHRAAFLAFLRFLKENLAGTTVVRIDPHWASQINTVRGFAEFSPPDLILREDRLEEDLIILASQLGKFDMPAVKLSDPHADRLSRIYDAEIEAAVRQVYQPDYDAFGFESYSP